MGYPSFALRAPLHQCPPPSSKQRKTPFIFSIDGTPAAHRSPFLLLSLPLFPIWFFPSRQRVGTLSSRGLLVCGSTFWLPRNIFPSNIEEPRFQQSAHQEVKGKRQVNFVWGCSREALQLLTSRFVFCAWSLLLVTSRRLLVCGSTPAPKQEGVQSFNRAAAGRQREAWRCGKTQGVGSGWT